ncbi:hypothetical protein MKW94_001127 [Papaver nudicaule]|uniref:TF-B3 domain-containing protein n=1 Tax=Papaver nudicaule TaxID=74823 RepID=A0AA41UWB9_PAPNU|nr:hypothetical protein [Papaver nudicaule]MCL7032305.1 hypothetical protein [Papaver nudicaule]
MGTRQNYGRPSFYKVMMGDFERKLKIPVNFIGNFDGLIPYDSVLRSPIGCWNVKVREEEDGSLSFRKGWPEFVEAHYLGHEDFVTMKYLGNSQFAVKLYGKNGCEKVLPCTGSNNGVKSIPSRKRKEYGETSREKITSNGSEFDQHEYRAGDVGRDTSCSDKRNCGLFKCDVPKRKETAMEGRTKVDQVEGSRKGKPCFLSIWTENKKFQMEIPEKVLRKIGRTLSDIVALKSADDRLWNVELKRSEGKVWFYKGWKEFTEHHSLRDGHVLGISYNGNSQFCVRIIDAMEPLDDSGNPGESNPKKRCRLSKRKEKEKNDGVILLDAPPSRTHVESKTDGEKAQLSVPPGLGIPMQLNKNKGAKSLVSDETRSPCLENQRTASGEHLAVVRHQESEDTSDSPDASKLSLKSSRRTDGNERVAEITKLFMSQSQYPYFAVCMRDTYLNYGNLHIPKGFATKHLLKNIKNVMVRSSGDKVWTLGYFVRGSMAKLSTGWATLRRDLGLTEGDVCVFELLKEKDTEMRVSVFREIDNVITRI